MYRNYRWEFGEPPLALEGWIQRRSIGVVTKHQGKDPGGADRNIADDDDGFAPSV
jgi:hypothetical protein